MCAKCVSSEKLWSAATVRERFPVNAHDSALSASLRDAYGAMRRLLDPFTEERSTPHGLSGEGIPHGRQLTTGHILRPGAPSVRRQQQIYKQSGSLYTHHPCRRYMSPTWEGTHGAPREENHRLWRRSTMRTLGDVSCHPLCSVAQRPCIPSSRLSLNGCASRHRHLLSPKELCTLGCRAGKL